MSQRRTGIREVAERAGVAVSSVSRVFNQHQGVSDDLRARVMAAVSELGYQPDLVAQGLRLRSTHSVGFVVGDISNPLISEIALGAERELRAFGYAMLLTNSENHPDLDANNVRLFNQRRVDGLILSLASETHPATLAALRTLDEPIVVMDRELPADAGIAYRTVLSDHLTGIRDATRHLIELGHRRIGMLVGPDLRFSRNRVQGLVTAYEEAGLAATYRVIGGAVTFEEARAATRELLDGRPPSTAIIVGNNQLTLGVLAELRERGRRIGQDISLVSCDAVPVTEFHEPQIAIVRRDTQEIGRQAAKLLLSGLAPDGHPEGDDEVVLLPTEFVARPSCAPPPA